MKGRLKRFNVLIERSPQIKHFENGDDGSRLGKCQFRYASRRLRDNRTLLKWAIRQNPFAILYASPRIFFTDRKLRTIAAAGDPSGRLSLLYRFAIVAHHITEKGVAAFKEHMANVCAAAFKAKERRFGVFGFGCWGFFLLGFIA